MATKSKINFNEINLNAMVDFQQEIIQIKTDNDISVLESIIHYCDKRDLDVEDVIPLISDSLKDIMESEETKTGNLKSDNEFKMMAIPLNLI